MSKIFVTSDTHFYHNNILKYENRPFKDINDMNNKMIESWNETVSSKDEVYILGDFSFGNEGETIKLLNKLNGKKYLIKGNHDHVVKNKDVRDKFEWIKDYFVLKHNKMKFVMFHYPIQVWDCRHHGAIHLYGHIHSNLGNHSMEYDIPNSYNVGVDVNGFKPVLIEDIIEKLK